MVPPLLDLLPNDLFSCRLCFDVVLEPTTVPCCGGTFCRSCLQKWLVKNVRLSGVARCPQGCGRRLPLQLPAPSRTLERALKVLLPEQLEARRREAASDDEPDIPGGFALLQKVAASRDLTIGEGRLRKVVVPFGVAGMVVGRSEGDGEERVAVKFEGRLDGCEGYLAVLCSEVVSQLPASLGVLLGQQVVATRDLMIGPIVGVIFGERGIVLDSHKGQAGEDRITVRFESRTDGGTNNVSCLPSELEPSRKLAGGFELAQAVVAARDVFSGNTRMLIVRCGTRGKIMQELNDMRVIVRFDEREDDLHDFVSVVPSEIEVAPD